MNIKTLALQCRTAAQQLGLLSSVARSALLEAMAAALDADAEAILADEIPRHELLDIRHILEIRRALAHTGGHRMEAAAWLGWGRNTLTRKIQELGLGPELRKGAR